MIDGDGGNGLFRRETGREKFSILPGDFGSRGDTGGLLLKGDVGDVGCRSSKSAAYSSKESSERRAWARIPFNPGSGV